MTPCDCNSYRKYYILQPLKMTHTVITNVFLNFWIENSKSFELTGSKHSTTLMTETAQMLQMQLQTSDMIDLRFTTGTKLCNMFSQRVLYLRYFMHIQKWHSLLYVLASNSLLQYEDDWITESEQRHVLRQLLKGDLQWPATAKTATSTCSRVQSHIDTISTYIINT